MCVWRACSCCARTLTNEEAEAHLYLALYNHGGAALAAQAVSADAGAPRTAAAVRASLRELSAVPMQVMWAAEHCTAEHMRQKEYIVSTFNLRQVGAALQPAPPRLMRQTAPIEEGRWSAFHRCRGLRSVGSVQPGVGICSDLRECDLSSRLESMGESDGS